MTTAAPSPSGPVKRSKRLYILWAIALTLLLTAGLFCWTVVVPVWSTHRVLSQCVNPSYPPWYVPAAEGDPSYLGFTPIRPREAVKRLGGPQETASKLVFYLRMPAWIAGDRWRAVGLLGYCGKHGLSPLEQQLVGADDNIRAAAASALANVGKAAAAVTPALMRALSDDYRPVRAPASLALSRIGAPAVPPLVVALKDSDPELRFNAAWTLGRIGPEASDAMSALEVLLGDEDQMVRQAAAAALKKIKAAQEKK
jgi:HEAT repeats